MTTVEARDVIRARFANHVSSGKAAFFELADNMAMTGMPQTVFTPDTLSSLLLKNGWPRSRASLHGRSPASGSRTP